MLATICAKCNQLINDQYILLALDRSWHESCLQCSDCSAQLKDRCFAHQGNIYCPQDYYRRFGPNCSGCQQRIEPDQLVHRIKERIFHYKCLYCCACRKLLSTGEQLFMIDNNQNNHNNHNNDANDDTTSNNSNSNSKSNDNNNNNNNLFLCKQDFLLHKQLHVQAQNSTNEASQSSFLINKTELKQEPESEVDLNILVQTSPPPQQPAPPSPPPSITHSTSSSNMNSTSQRNKRLRTSFKHHQLRAMKLWFSKNQNPDAKELKQLAQQTGLSKRVLQVWFQNARAKDRRNNLRQNGHQMEQAMIARLQ